MGDDSEDNNYSESDSDLDDQKHNKLIQNVLNLTKKSGLKKSSRTEPTLQISEFNLVKSSTGKKGSVHLSDLTKSLNNRASHVELGKKIKENLRKVKTLTKPLEKPQADRIKRTIAYNQTKDELDRWDAVVTSNRAAETLRFPLNYDELNLTNETAVDDSQTRFKLKSKLQLALDEIEPPKVEIIEVDTGENEFPLTMEEMIEKRKESAKLRAVQSYKESKARRQSKIKSKKFHKIEKRERVKQQIKDFESLQKTNPEAALEKLDEIERARAHERISLRHKSTGQWAKNKQIRAKYDNESRQVLAEQLAISRDLTQKLKNNKSDSEDEMAENTEDVAEVKIDKNNPWTTNTKIKPSEEVTSFVSGYRKFWSKEGKEISGETNQEEENSNEVNEKQIKINGLEKKVEQPENNKINLKKASKESKIKMNKDINTENVLIKKSKKKNVYETNKKQSKVKVDKEVNANDESVNVKNKKSKNKKNKSKKNNDIAETNTEIKNSKSKPQVDKEMIITNNSKPVQNRTDGSSNDNTEQVKTKKTKNSKKNKKNDNIEETHLEISANATWIVSNVDDETAKNIFDIDGVFDQVEDKMKKTIKGRLEKFKNSEEKIKLSKKAKKSEGNEKNRKLTNLESLEMNSKKKKVNYDEELIEGDESFDKPLDSDNLQRLENILKQARKKTHSNPNEIDPNKFMDLKPVKLNTALPNLLVDMDNENDDVENAYNVISEAFQDDDIMTEFIEDKQADIDKSAGKEVDMTLPGWGSWGGKNLQISKRKRKRFIVKAPKPEVRRDENKGNLIINENAANAKLKEHMVSDIPFPYKNIKEYETSIQTPIDSAFIPQLAHRKLIEPAVITKMGTIIKPMTSDILLKKSVK